MQKSLNIKQCEKCGQNFRIFNEDLNFYNKFNVPVANKCPNCRLERRLMERNAKHLYYRKCDATGKKTLSQYHEKQPFPVYSPHAWWSDSFDALKFGIEFDFSRGFFEQFLELRNKTPHLALFNTESTIQNSDFNNCTAYIKNCYLVAETDHCEDCYYSNLLKRTKSSVDCSVCYDDELCYECIDCTGCYSLNYSKDCKNCKDSYFLLNCISCQDCIFCANQRHKRYMVFNKQYSKEEFKKLLEGLQLSTRSGFIAAKKKANQFFVEQPKKALNAEHNENSIGEHLTNSKNAFFCFDCDNVEDCRYCAKLTMGVKTSMDYNSWGNQSELMYQCSGCGDHNYNMKCCVRCHTDMRDCCYCDDCFSCSDCFGCIGLKKKSFCILNKKYSESEYKVLREKIIEHMRQRGEWGEFFPVALCPFAYNETIAMDTFPLTKEQSIAKGYKWLEEEKKTTVAQQYTVPENIDDVSDDICQAVLLCDCGKNFKIILQELLFYQQQKIPIPAKCNLCRHKLRMVSRNSLKLFEGICARCNSKTITSYSTKEQIYCEKCYLEAVY